MTSTGNAPMDGDDDDDGVIDGIISRHGVTAVAYLRGLRGLSPEIFEKKIFLLRALNCFACTPCPVESLNILCRLK